MKILFFLLLALSLNAVPSTRKSVSNNLNTIVVKEITLDDLTIEEFMKLLQDKSGGKVNFIYFQKKGVNPPPVASTNNVPAFDPLTGLPIGNLQFNIPLPIALLESKSPRIRAIHASLKNITLKQLLDISIICFDQPMKYVVADFGVVFIPLEDGEKQLFLRRYQINPNIFKR